jgi:hypothetical protein
MPLGKAYRDMENLTSFTSLRKVLKEPLRFGKQETFHFRCPILKHNALPFGISSATHCPYNSESAQLYVNGCTLYCALPPAVAFDETNKMWCNPSAGIFL